MPVHFIPAHKYDTLLDKDGGLRHFCSVLINDSNQQTTQS